MSRFIRRDVLPVDQSADYGGQYSVGAVAGFFNIVYAWMSAGLALTAVVAWWASTRPDVMKQIFHGGTLVMLLIAELVLVWVVSAATNRISATAATGLFLLYAALNGLTFSAIFLIYSLPSIAGAFIVCAAMFGAMSVYGMVTKTDLSRFGSLLFMCLIGLVIATLVNAFVASSGLYWLVTYAGVIIFTGLAAYDTQRLRTVAIQTANYGEMSHRLAITGALQLYLDFINLFLFLLRLMGDRRR